MLFELLVKCPIFSYFFIVFPIFRVQISYFPIF